MPEVASFSVDCSDSMVLFVGTPVLLVQVHRCGARNWANLFVSLNPNPPASFYVLIFDWFLPSYSIRFARLTFRLCWPILVLICLVPFFALGELMFICPKELAWEPAASLSSSIESLSYWRFTELAFGFCPLDNLLIELRDFSCLISGSSVGIFG